MTVRLIHVTTVPMTLHFLEGQLSYMMAHGFETYVVSSPGADLDAFLRKEPDVRAHPLPMERSVTPLRDLVALGRMIRLLRRIRPAIVHTHTPKGGLLGTIAARVTGTPVIFHHIHGGVWLAATGWRRAIARWTDRVTCALAHRVFCVSHSVRDALVREALCDPDKIEVLCSGSINGVDALGRFNPDRLDETARLAKRHELGIPEGAVVIGFVGRLTSEKGMLELSEAWNRLAAEHPMAHLLLVGPEDPVTPLPSEIATSLQTDPRVHLAGMTWDTAPLYAVMDVFALPTYREGFPVVLLEAAAMRLPIVATSVPGCTDAVVQGATGVLVPPREAAPLRDQLARYVTDGVRRRRHGEAGRQRVLLEFRPEAIWRELLDRYRSALGVSAAVRLAARAENAVR